jgi:hypothetical protein
MKLSWRVTASIVMTVALMAGSAPAWAAPPSTTGRNGTIYFIGDSWSSGLFADPDHTLAQDAAADVGMGSDVDAESGTGYVAAPLGTQNYVERAASIPAGTTAGIVVIQGGSNDDGTDPATLLAAVTQTIAEVRHALPSAAVVLLGPGPDPWPVTAKQTAVDTVLERAASEAGVDYISPTQEGWFTSSTVGAIIDPVTAHPTVSGDQILGHLLADDLHAIVPRPTTAAAVAAAPNDVALRQGTAFDRWSGPIRIAVLREQSLRSRSAAERPRGS